VTESVPQRFDEFLKEHRKVQQLKAVVAKQQASAAKEQAAIT